MIVKAYRTRQERSRDKSDKRGKLIDPSEFVLCQWDLVISRKAYGVEVSDELGRFYVGQGQYIWSGGRLRLHTEFEIQYM